VSDTIAPGLDDDFPDDVHVRAGEYVLGVLDAPAAASVRRDAMTNLELADAIVRWEVRLAPLGGVIPPIRPLPTLWQRIEASLDAATSGRVVPFAPRRGIWRNATVWRSTTVAALALAAAMAFVAFLPHGPRLVQVAALVPLAGQGPLAAAFVARVSTDGSVVLTAVSPVSVPSGRDLQLWLMPPGAQRPISLGLLPASGRTVTLPGATENGAQLLVSLEPRGGSPTGLPTGPVLYGGTLASG
jgi:anti-sigma-K factor RskA